MAALASRFEIFPISGKSSATGMDTLGRAMHLAQVAPCSGWVLTPIPCARRERIILGSIFTRCESLLRPSIEDSISKEAMPETGKACTIVPAELGESIGDFGAATVAALGIENELETLK